MEDIILSEMRDPIFESFRNIHFFIWQMIPPINVHILGEQEERSQVFEFTGNRILYAPRLVQQYDLTQEECHALLLHIIHPLINGNFNEEYMEDEQHILAADFFASQYATTSTLISAIRKVYTDSQLRRKRIVNLKERELNELINLHNEPRANTARELLETGIRQILLDCNEGENIYRIQDKEHDLNKCGYADLLAVKDDMLSRN